MKAFAVILAAGQGTRYGADKTQLPLRGKPLWRWSFDTFAAHPEVAGVGLVGSTSNLAALQSSGADFVVSGGATRQESSLIGVENVPHECDLVLIHDAARPLVSGQLISTVIAAARESGAAAPALTVSDTIRQADHGTFGIVPRERLHAMQTPQAGGRELFLSAHARAEGEFTDDLALLENIGVVPKLVPGEKANMKVTGPEDLRALAGFLPAAEQRTGIGYDIHPFSKNPKPCILGGVHFEDAPGLEGHSDADVLLHAVTDAVLGAASLGDIGQHFPNTDDQWKDCPSSTFLSHANRLIQEAGWRIVNIDATAIAEFPKIMKKADEIKAHMARTLGVERSRISIKATTNERLGSIGRGEGIAAFATATIAQLP